MKCQHEQHNAATCPVCSETFCFDCNPRDLRHHGGYTAGWQCPGCRHDMDAPADFRLIRRRIEDRLRKGTDKEIVSVAKLLGVYC